MDKLKETEFFPAAKEEEDLPSWSRKLLRWLEKEVWFRISKRINWVLDRQKDNSFEITRDGQGIDEDGNFKIERNGDNWEAQIKSSGTWVTVFIFHGS